MSSFTTSALELGSSITALRDALDRGDVTSVELVAYYLNRIAAFDRSDTCVNAVPLLSPDVFADARAADERRAAGAVLGPLDGIPYVVKDSFKVAGMTVASGSPAFKELRAGDDAFTVGRLRAAGAVIIGKTTMPPMAAGGMQRGVYGRAESPFNPDYLASGWFSGSSNGSGVAVAADFCVFALAEETVSSGRSPASNNGLVAYTPSRGVLSIRGNWPLLAIRDVVVPYARTVADLLEVLNVIVDDDPLVSGDLWRAQTAVTLPAASEVRPADYLSLAASDALAGKRIGVPRVFVGGGEDLPRPIVLRPSIAELWQRTADRLRALGAEVVEVDFPVFTHYERLTPDALDPEDRGWVPKGFLDVEFNDLLQATWDEFLRSNGDPTLHRLEDVDAAAVFPDELAGLGPDVNPLPRIDNEGVVARSVGGSTPVLDIPGLDEALRGIERFRDELYDKWLDELDLDALAFPTNTDVGRATADRIPEDSIDAWRNGVACSTGNFMTRHLGIPTVSLPMGVASDIAMPVDVTLAGRAYDDNSLLAMAYALEQGSSRPIPSRTPALAAEERIGASRAVADSDLCVEVSVKIDASGRLDIRAQATSADVPTEVRVYVDGRMAGSTRDVVDGRMELDLTQLLSGEDIGRRLVVAVAADAAGAIAGSFEEVSTVIS